MAKDDRLRVPIDDAYLHALGLALYNFATLEWNAVYVAQYLGERGYSTRAPASYHHILRSERKTAGDIGDDILAYLKGVEDLSIKQAVKKPALRYKELTLVRNAIMHANPGTAPNRDQRLFRDGKQWTIDEVNQASDDFAECSGQLNHLLYHLLV